MDELPAAVMVDRLRLIDALDSLADVAAAIERHADGLSGQLWIR